MPLAALTFHRSSVSDPHRPLAPGPGASGLLLEQVAKSQHVSEAVVLATCERAEIYMVVERFHGAIADARDALARVMGMSPAEIGPYLVDRHDEGVVRHLVSVAAGLDSAVVGESEILGQVARAWELARSEGTARSTLNDLFRHAVVAGKRARSETHIAEGIRTIGSAAVGLVAHVDLRESTVVVVGTGDAATSVAHAMSRAGVRDMKIVGRSLERAETLAARVDATAVSVDSMADELRVADVVVSATSAAGAVVDASMFVSGSGPKVVVDLGEPADVDVAVDSLDGVRVLRLDAVREVMQDSRDKRLVDTGAVQQIVEEECDRYVRNVRERGAGPLVVDLRARVELQRKNELERFASRLASLDDEQRRVVEELTGALAAKFVHLPTVNLKALAGSPEGDRLIESARKLFDV